MSDVRRRQKWWALAAPATALALLITAPPAPASAVIPTSTSSGPYTYLARQPLNQRASVRWYPCATHTYKIYVGGSTSAQRSLLRNTVARLSRVSGIPMRFASSWRETTPPPPRNRHRSFDRSLNVLAIKPPAWTCT